MKHWALIVGTGIVAGILVWWALGADDASASSAPNPPLVVWVSKGQPTSDGLGLRATLIAYKARDTAGSGMMVFVTTCRFGQHLPFKVFVGRKLDAANEKFSSSNDGRMLIWNIRNVPTSAAGPARLPLQFQVPLGKRGPTYCIKVWGSSLDGTQVAKVTRLVWKL